MYGDTFSMWKSNLSPQPYLDRTFTGWSRDGFF